LTKPFVERFYYFCIFENPVLSFICPLLCTLSSKTKRKISVPVRFFFGWESILFSRSLYRIQNICQSFSGQLICCFNRMGINIPCSRWRSMPQTIGHCSDVCTTSNQQCGIRMA